MKCEILLVSDHLGLRAWAWRAFQSWTPCPGSRRPRGQLFLFYPEGWVAESWRAVGRRLGLSGVGKASVSLGTCRFGGARGLAGSGAWRGVSGAAQTPPGHRGTEPAPSEKPQGSSEYWLMLVKRLKIKYAVREQVFCFSCIEFGDQGDERGISILREKCWA